jgi:uncharacterized iron-regulated membrane protein
MPEATPVEVGSLGEALPLDVLVERAREALSQGRRRPEVDRMDVRPDDGFVKVRFDDRVVTEVTVDLVSGAVLQVGERNDVFLQKLHSGEIFGDRGVFLSDAAAVILTLLILSGYWLWLYPKRRIG